MKLEKKDIFYGPAIVIMNFAHKNTIAYFLAWAGFMFFLIVNVFLSVMYQNYDRVIAGMPADQFFGGVGFLTGMYAAFGYGQFISYKNREEIEAEKIMRKLRGVSLSN